MKLISLIKYFEFYDEYFYEHLKRFDDTYSEINLVNKKWLLRTIAYQGEWIEINPIHLSKEHQQKIEEYLVNNLLTKYCYLKRIEPNEFQEIQIEKLLSKELCLQAIENMNQFEKNLIDALKNLQKPDLKIIT